ncbi:hypothetical protein K431DRAFT_264936 [Polychaeton citri CBS 116435]|uniref:histidine kinase n=1 Tax=Polychaeton citri CBS 116435 TaxID=1314669 RepID=A0A9P4QCF2_9PEZI|nr:hypothetical protein K431DRAFT_264936 [Polychaeton citri CBS 116435]
MSTIELAAARAKSPATRPFMSSEDFKSTPKERARAVELAKYFSSASVIPVGSKSAGVSSADVPRPSPDTGLTALAQLGTFKLDCDRAFISLIDRTHQYLVGEATKSTALSVDNLSTPGDGLYLGFRALELDFGVCPMAMQVFTSDDRTIDTPNISADQTSYVIRDFRADPHFSTKPYVTEWPHFRSYAEVPLKSVSGSVIGSYCVVDNKPRTFDDSDIMVLHQIASTVMNHLDLLKTSSEFNRAERLVRGLGSFVAGHSGLQEQQTMLLPESAVQDVNPIVQDAEESRLSLTYESSSISRPSTSARSGTSGLGTSATLPDFESANESIATHQSFQAEAWHEANGQAEVDTAVPQSIRAIFSRASNLIRQSMDMQGVVFLDASGHRLEDSAKPTTKTTNQHETSIFSAGVDQRRSSLAHSIEIENFQGDVVLASALTGLSEGFLERMLARYPFGHVFSFDEMGVVSAPTVNQNYGDRTHPSRYKFTSSHPIEDHADKDAAELFGAIDGTRSIFFLPLWDFQKGQWFAAAIGWTRDPARVFGPADLNYLSAFGNSIMADVSRIEASALSRAKSSFISSISHELRSPLHGILAGVELLQESVTSSWETSMLNTIDSCGKMLLDTMNHLLDFSKINSLTSRSNLASSDDSRKTVSESSRLTAVNLGRLVQDVVEGISLGFSADYSSARMLDKGNAAIALSSEVDTRKEEHVRNSDTNDTIVLVDIDPSVDWAFEIEVGAWKRIIMNILGNALKYTSGGYINVSLRIVNRYPEISSILDSAKQICLEINDTGRGISEEYLRCQLYTPFSQENHLSVGAGLGLSIVKQLVDTLDGSISVRSKLGTGTKVRIMMPVGDKMRKLNETQQPDKCMPNRPGVDDRFKGCILYLPSYGAHYDTTEDPQLRRTFAARELFASTAERWFGMVVLPEARSNDVETDQTAHRFTLLRSKTPGDSEWVLSLRHSPHTMLSSNGVDSDRSRLEETIHHPFGPRKLLAALSAILKQKETQQPPAPASTSSSVSASASVSDSIPTAASVSAATPDARLRGSDAKEETTDSHMTANVSPTLEITGVKESKVKASISPARPASTSNEASRLLNLLLVDDNDVNLKVLSACVQKVGCTFTKSMNGLEAVEAYTRSVAPIDLIFMDLSMPVMDGWEATRKIREHERKQGLQRAKIIALTALGSSDARREALESGFDLFVSKPVRMSEVRTLVQGAGNALKSVQIPLAML